MVDAQGVPPTMVIVSRVKDYIKSKGLRSDGNLDDALNKMLTEQLDKAIQRCKDNGRQTVRPSDL